MTTFETTYVQTIHTPLIGQIGDKRSELVRPSVIPQPELQTVKRPMNPMLILLPIVLFIIAGFIYFGPKLGQGENEIDNVSQSIQNNLSAGSLGLGLDSKVSQMTSKKKVGDGRLSSIFSPEIQYWAPQILKWADAHSLDPDAVATIMQIESCGYPEAESSAGAQGLFQVMPFHFESGENMRDPNTNANRGLSYFAERLQQTSGDIYLAFAGYNGGHVAAATSWNNWAAETQRYYRWSQGIYDDAKAGMSESPTLAEWVKAGGASLCQQAASYLQIQ
ncbi:MAG: lytic transglycosylase domain-containing protein [Anaerolineae bacterium]